jgi:hypothetical protein
MGTMPLLSREPARPKATSVPQAMDKYAPAAEPVFAQMRASQNWAVTAIRSDGPAYAPTLRANPEP